MPRSLGGRLVLLLVLLWLINATTWLVVTGNQHNALYPVNADSVVIPLFNTALASALVLPFLLVAGWLPNAPVLVRVRARGPLWSIGSYALLFVGYLSGVFFCLVGAAYWALPNHYSITCSYAALLLALMGLALVDVSDGIRGRRTT